MRKDEEVIELKSQLLQAEATIASLKAEIEAGQQVEMALRLQQSELRALFDLIPAMVWFKDTNNRILRVNQRVAHATGKSIEEIEGKPTLDIYPQDAAKYFDDDLAVIRAGIPKLGVVEKLHDSAGKELWVQTDKVPYRDTDGKIVGIVVMAQDLTEQKRIETRFRRIVESNAQAVFLWNTKGEITAANDAFLKLTHHTQEDLEARRINWVAMTPPEYADLDRLALEELAATGVCATYEKEYLIKDGTRVPILLGAAVFEDNPDEGVCFVLDITERKRSEAILHLRDRAIRAVSQSIVITDCTLPDNPIVYVSPSFEQMTGYSSEEAIGRNCRFLQGKDTNPETVEKVREAISKVQSCTVELINYRKDGTPFWNSLTISPVLEPSGKLVNFVGVQTDVTAQRQLEQQLQQSQKMEAIGQLAGGIAHDFNNLLTVINGYSGLLLTSLHADVKAQRYLTLIKEAGEQSAALTSQLLAFSRNQFLTAKNIDLNDVVRKVETMLGRIIGEDLQIATVLQPDLGRINADPTQIEQILLNLSVNARDAMPQGGKLTIETHNVELDSHYASMHMYVKPGPYVLLAMTDTGMGMTEDVKQHIFEPFFTTKGVGKGTGLGLAVIHGIVKQSEGSIEVYSEPGRGTCFKVYLPQVECTAPTVVPAPDATELTKGSETILLVEDEPKVREFTRHVLEECGYTILVACNAKDALEISKTYCEPIHLLLTDVVMPEMGGRALAEQLQAEYPKLTVMFMSGYTEDAVVRHGILHEDVHFVQKPFSPLTLAQKIRDVLGHR